MRASTLFAALLLLAPAAAQARPPLTLGLGFAGQVVTGRAWDLVDENDHLPMLRLGAGWAFDAPGGKLEAGAGFLTGSTQASFHQTGQANLWMRGLELSATYRRPLVRFFTPYARLGAGLDWATLSIGNALEQTDLSPSASGMLGFTFPFVRTSGGARGPHEWLVLDLGVGYAVRPAFDFDEMLPPGYERGGSDSIDRAPVDMGTISTSGVVYRVGLTVCL